MSGIHFEVVEGVEVPEIEQKEVDVENSAQKSWAYFVGTGLRVLDLEHYREGEEEDDNLMNLNVEGKGVRLEPVAVLDAESSQ